MKVFGMIAVLLFSMAASAQNNEVSCVVKVNGEIRYDFILASPEGQKIEVGEFEGYKVLLNHTANSRYSMEIYDIDATTRSYADATLRNLEDDVTNTIWKREILVEAQCKLHK